MSKVSSRVSGKSSAPKKSLHCVSIVTADLGYCQVYLAPAAYQSTYASFALYLSDTLSSLQLYCDLPDWWVQHSFTALS